MTISQRKVVAGALFLLVAVLMVLTFGLSPVARLVPTYVVLPTLGLLLLNLVFEFMRPEDTSTVTAPCDDRTIAVKETRVLAWVLLLPALAFLTGLVLAVLVYVYFYARRWLEWDRFRSLVASMLLTGIVYTAIYLAVGARLLDGWLWSQAGLQG